MKNPPKLATAITPGEVEHIPDFVNNVIDIKTRLIDITSIIEILNHFNILNKFATTLSAKYIQDIIRLIKTGNKLLTDSSNMKEQFKTVINNVHDGLIAINQENKISVFNPIAEKIFEQNATNIIGQNEEENTR